MAKFKFSVVLALVVLFASTFSSCEKESEAPDYVGTWENVEQDNSKGMLVTLTMTLTLTESSFDMSISIDLGQDFIVPGGGMKGTMSVSGDQMTVSPTSIGSVNESMAVVWVNKGQPGWAEALEEMDMDDPEVGTYKVAGNELTITFDDEPQTFTKK